MKWFISLLILVLSLSFFRLEAGDQPLGVSLLVDKAFFPKGGYVVVFNKLSAQPGWEEVVNYSDYFAPGYYADFSFLIMTPTDKVTPQAGDSLHLLIYEDNGDKFFNLNLDRPVKDWLGRPLISNVKVY